MEMGPDSRFPFSALPHNSLFGRGLTPPAPLSCLTDRRGGEQDLNQTLPPLLTGALSRQERGAGG
jgi:hypothetical protein